MSHSSRRYFLKTAACACCLAVSNPTFSARAITADSSSPPALLPTILELGTKNMESIGDSVWVSNISPNVWLYTVTHPIGEFIYPANGLIILSTEGAILIDTGWTSQHSRILIDWIDNALKAKTRLAIATHFHDDRTGGISALRERTIRCVSHPLTSIYAKERGYNVPEPLLPFGKGAYKINDQCELFFAGAGHTADNIVAWLPHEKILYGGCFIKSETSPDLGNLSDAVVTDWSSSLKKLTSQYPSRNMAIPGHGTLTGDAIGRTFALLASHKGK